MGSAFLIVVHVTEVQAVRQGPSVSQVGRARWRGECHSFAVALHLKSGQCLQGGHCPFSLKEKQIPNCWTCRPPAMYQVQPVGCHSARLATVALPRGGRRGMIALLIKNVSRSVK